MSDPTFTDTTSETIERYLTALTTQLAGPAQTKETIVAEMRDGLLQATQTHVRRGLPPAAAADAAIEEFGDPALLAAAFAPELAAVRARRTALSLLATGPLVGGLWLAALFAAGAIPPGVDAWTPGRGVLGVAIVGAVVAALLTVASTGRSSRRLSPSPRLAPTAAATAGALAAMVDLTVVATLGVVATTAPVSLAWAPAALAASASLTRLRLASRAARRCLAARATLA